MLYTAIHLKLSLCAINLVQQFNSKSKTSKSKVQFNNHGPEVISLLLTVPIDSSAKVCSRCRVRAVWAWIITQLKALQASVGTHDLTSARSRPPKETVWMISFYKALLLSATQMVIISTILCSCNHTYFKINIFGKRYIPIITQFVIAVIIMQCVLKT